MRAHPEIEALVAELLNSGVSPRYVSRLASELDDHYADLEAEARRLGVPESEAAEDARARLGACSAIAKEFARRPELRAWVYTSRWLRSLLRAAGAVYLLLICAPARAVAGGQEAMLRYTAATAAGSSITFGILLLLTAVLSPNSIWGETLAEQAGAALSVWQHERAARGGAGTRLVAPPSTPRRTERSAPRTEPAPERTGAAVPPAGSLQGVLSEGIIVDTRRVLPPARQAAVSPTQLLAQSRPVLDDPKVRITLTALEPAVHLGIGPLRLRPVSGAEPVYPDAAARRGLEGHAIVEYTVTRAGTVSDVIVVESSHPLFERPALDAARTLTYRPRTIRGQPVDVRGVRILIRFELEA